ncbi:MAG: hypothetical protein HND48_26950 [Chloroflexi bacterium]|nr:hypothetical protein [Chloroflexota bacterium]
MLRATTGETIVIGDDISADEAGIAGGTLGAAMTALGFAQLGALALPGVGVIIALGAGVLVGGLVGGATGRFAANLVDSGFKSSQIDSLADRLRSGHPALVLEMSSGSANPRSPAARTQALSRPVGRKPERRQRRQGLDLATFRRHTA